MDWQRCTKQAVSQRFVLLRRIHMTSHGARSDKCRDVKQHRRGKATNSYNVAMKHSKLLRSLRVECRIDHTELISWYGNVRMCLKTTRRGAQLNKWLLVCHANAVLSSEWLILWVGANVKQSPREWITLCGQAGVCFDGFALTRTIAVTSVSASVFDGGDTDAGASWCMSEKTYGLHNAGSTPCALFQATGRCYCHCEGYFRSSVRRACLLTVSIKKNAAQMLRVFPEAYQVTQSYSFQNLPRRALQFLNGR